MTASQIMFEQQHLAPKADLSGYVGEWVLLRDGTTVVSHGEDPAALGHQSDARAGDTLILVPPGATTILVS